MFGLCNYGLTTDRRPSFDTSPLKGVSAYDYRHSDAAIAAPPLAGEDEAVAAPLPAMGSDDVPEPPREVRASNAEVMEKARDSKKNTVDFAAWNLTELVKYRRFDGCFVIKDHFFAVFRKYLSEHMEKSKARVFLTQLSNGLLTKTCVAALKKSSDTEAFGVLRI